jgi:hypothetical protein
MANLPNNLHSFPQPSIYIRFIAIRPGEGTNKIFQMFFAHYCLHNNRLESHLLPPKNAILQQDALRYYLGNRASNGYVIFNYY